MYFIARVNPYDIDFVNKIIEGYEGYGIVTTDDPKLGLIRIYVSPDTREEVAAILDTLPVNVSIEDFVE